MEGREGGREENICRVWRGRKGEVTYSLKLSNGAHSGGLCAEEVRQVVRGDVEGRAQCGWIQT